jgi:hypothetical protein
MAHLIESYYIQAVGFKYHNKKNYNSAKWILRDKEALSLNTKLNF